MFRLRHLSWSVPIRGGLASSVLAILVVTTACTTGGTAVTSVTPAPTAAGASHGAVSTTPTPIATPDFPATLTDDEGTSFTIGAEPRTIVSLAPATTETLFALGVGGRVKGKVQDVFLYPPQASDVPDIATYSSIDFEKIVAIAPDVVFAGGNSLTPPDAITKLRSLGLTVAVLYAPSVDGVYRDIALTGQVVGRSEQARSIIDRLRAGFATVKAAVAGLPTPRVFYELDATGAIYGPADTSFLAEMIELAGGTPVTTGSADKFDISVERLIQQDPEVILLADAPFGVTAEQVAARPGWKVMTAVKDGQIRPIDDQTISRPGPRLFLGLSLLAKTIHPEAAIPSMAPIPAAP